MINIFAFSDKGCILAVKISKLFSGSKCYSTNKLADIYNINGCSSVCKTAGELFNSSSVMIFVGATGIAVRSISPYVKSKLTDPAVISIDDCGRFVISLLSGHIGGANEIASYIATEINAIPVITTATDINGKFSVDTWANKNDFYITSMKIARDISAEILERNIGFYSDLPFKESLPNGLEYKYKGKIGICLSYRKIKPFDLTLNIIPKNICVGIGCRRDTDFKVLEKHFIDTLNINNIDIKSVCKITSIDIKSDEVALLKLREKYGIELEFYSAKELENVKGDFANSDFVKAITGVDNVCERSACLASENGEKLLGKTACSGVTMAIYKKQIEVKF